MESKPSASIEPRGEHSDGTRPDVALGYLFAAIGATLFSTKAIIIKLAYAETIDAETLLALRMALSLPFYLIIGAVSLTDRFRHSREFPSLKLVTYSALVGALGYWFASYTDFIGLVYISAQFERLILFTYPLFVVLLGAMFFGHRVRSRTLFAFGVSYLGLALIFSESFAFEGENVAVGSAFVILAAISFALYQLLAKGLISKVGPRLFTCIAMIGATVGAFMQFLVTHDAVAILVGPTLLIYGVLIAIFSTVLPSFFLSEALHRISAQANGVIGTLSPLVTIILAALILGERMTPIGAIGAALVLSGVGWFTVSEKR
jgi:drug/metabolite transporter (DMT)-like permease